MELVETQVKKIANEMIEHYIVSEKCTYSKAVSLARAHVISMVNHYSLLSDFDSEKENKYFFWKAVQATLNRLPDGILY